MGTSAASVVGGYVREQVGAVLDGERGVRADAPDAVHQVRVATRRLRTTLRVYRRLMDRERTDPVREELRWVAAGLGAVRDLEVLRQSLLEDLGDLPPALVEGPVRARLRDRLDTAYAVARRELLATLGSHRYTALVRALEALALAPPWRGRAHQPAATVLPRLADRAFAWVDRARAAADATEDRDHRAVLLHETRKRAKAARYACDALVPAFGGPAERAAGRWEAVTDALGVVQDCRSAVGWIAAAAQEAGTAGEPVLTYGVLIGRQVERADAAAAEAAAALDRAATGKARRVTG